MHIFGIGKTKKKPFHTIELYEEDLTESGKQKLIDLYLFSNPELLTCDIIHFNWARPIMIASVMAPVGLKESKDNPRDVT